MAVLALPDVFAEDAEVRVGQLALDEPLATIDAALAGIYAGSLHADRGGELEPATL